MSVSPISNQLTRQSETKLFWWFYFSTVGNRFAFWFPLRDNLTCRMTRPSQHAMSGWTQLSFQIYQIEATQREVRQRLGLESEHESWTLREALHLHHLLWDWRHLTDVGWIKANTRFRVVTWSQLGSTATLAGTNSSVFVTEVKRNKVYHWIFQGPFAQLFKVCALV